MGTNTSDVEVRPHRDGTRTSTSDANAQASLPIVDVMLPSGRGDHLPIPQINLSISGYEPNSLRNSHIGSLPTQAQEILIMLQLDGPTSLPMRDPVGRRIHEDPRLVEREYSHVGTYVQGTSTSRRREYPGEGNDDEYRRSYRDRNPPERRRYSNQGGRPLTKEDTLMEDLLEEDTQEEDSLMEMEDPLTVEDPLADGRPPGPPG